MGRTSAKQASNGAGLLCCAVRRGAVPCPRSVPLCRVPRAACRLPDGTRQGRVTGMMSRSETPPAFLILLIIKGFPCVAGVISPLLPPSPSLRRLPERYLQSLIPPWPSSSLRRSLLSPPETQDAAPRRLPLSPRPRRARAAWRRMPREAGRAGCCSCCCGP